MPELDQSIFLKYDLPIYRNTSINESIWRWVTEFKKYFITGLIVNEPTLSTAAILNPPDINAFVHGASGYKRGRGGKGTGRHIPAQQEESDRQGSTTYTESSHLRNPDSELTCHAG